MQADILFDLDGTLTDSGEGIINSAVYALETMGYPVPPREVMGVFVGPPLWDTFEKFGVPREKTDEAVRIFRSRYIPIGKFENRPYAGIREMLEANGLEPDDVDCYLLHQANMRILEGVRTRLKVSEERFPHNIERTGNTSSATIPVLMDELNRAGKLKPGCRMILSAFGAGLCTGTALLEW